MAYQIHSAVKLQNQDSNLDVQGKRILVSLVIIITGGMITIIIIIIIIITIITLMVKLPLTQQRFMTTVCSMHHFGSLVKPMDIFSNNIFECIK